MNPPPELLSSNLHDGTVGSSMAKIANSNQSLQDLNDRESIISPKSRDMNGELMYDQLIENKLTTDNAN